MMSFRQYVTIPPSGLPPEARSIYSKRSYSDFENIIRSALGRLDSPDTAAASVVGLPSERFRLVLPSHPGISPPPIPEDGELVVALDFKDETSLETFSKDVSVRSPGMKHPSANPILRRADHWSPGGGEPTFSNRSGAYRLIGAAELGAYRGRDVNVVLVDEGVDRNAVGDSFAGGWAIDREGDAADREPGSTAGGHGAVTVRNILGIAPEARIFDMPLIPKDKPVLGFFLHEAQAAFATMLANIRWMRETLGEGFAGPWIIVNAWCVFGTEAEAPAGDYTANPEHPFNRLVEAMVDDGIDLVFAAGNCGQFAPHPRCGLHDIGPGRSILGANSHPRALSVGAVRADGMWIGYSSQGPGRLESDKPDLCAPSSFHEDDDVASGNTGTSAACAVAAGVLAALRSHPAGKSRPPDEIREILRKTARRRPGDDPTRTGQGILDASAALRALATNRAGGQ